MNAVHVSEGRTVSGGSGMTVRDVRSKETRRLLEIARRLPAIRQGKVRRMRSLIVRGKLVTPARLEETVRRIAKELGL